MHSSIIKVFIFISSYSICYVLFLMSVQLLSRETDGKDEEDGVGGSYLKFGSLRTVAWADWFDWE